MTIQDMQNRKKELGYTYETIASLSGVPLGTVQKVLGGITKSPRYDTIQALEKVLRQDEPSKDGAGYRYESPPAGEASLLREASAGYGAYVYGTSAHKGYEDSYRLLPFKRQGEYTAADRDALPEDVRTELIDGVLYDMASPGHIHQLLLGALHRILWSCIEESGSNCIAFMAPSDVWLDRTDKTILQPDVYVLCDDSMMEEDGYTHGAPPFVAEILSPSTASRDRGLKLTKYMAAGVREYWIIDPKKERIFVYIFDQNEEDALDPAIYSFDSDIPVHISEGHCKVNFSKVSGVLSRIKPFLS